MKTYTGGCHCKNIAYSVNIEDEIVEAVECNCSICESKGSLLVFVPKEQFTLEDRNDSLSEYQFNKKNIRHYFCKNCGVATHSEGVENTSVALNIRTVDGAEMQGIKRNHYNGREV
jgi:hypothetical protein